MTISLLAALLMIAFSLLPGPYERALLLGSAMVPLLALLQLVRGLTQGAEIVVSAQLPIRCSSLDNHAGADRHTCPGRLPDETYNHHPCGGGRLGDSARRVSRILRSIPAYHSADDNTGPHGSLAYRNRFHFSPSPCLEFIGTEIGTLLLGWLSGPREAGLYQPIAKLAPLMMLANGAIETSLAPKVVHSWEEGDRQTLRRRMGRSALAAALATAAIVGAIVVAGPYILRAFGPEFTKYQRLIVWIGVAQVVNAATGAAPLLLAMTGDMKSRIGAQAATMVVQVGLGIALIPTLGATGAVAALVAAILVWSFLHWWLALRATGIDTSLLGAFSGRRSAA